MKLTFEQLQAVTFGAVNIYEDEQKHVRFQRMLPQQQEAFRNESAALGDRAGASTGIRLDFYTNSHSLLLEISSPSKCEILVNGLQCKTFSGPLRITVSLPDDTNRVTVLFADHSPTVLRFVQLDEGSYVKPHIYDRKFLFLGDSITQGASSSRPSLQYANRISQFFNAQVMNWGVGSSFFTPDTLAQVPFDPDVVFIAYGTNDYTHFKSKEALILAAEEYMQRVKALFPNKTIIYISPLWRADGELIRPTGNHRQVCDLLRSIAANCGFTLIEGYTLLPHCEEFFNDQHLHPNDLGFSLYAQNLISQLSAYI